MDVRDERIIVFGDSLSHHGADSAPEIWDVDQGSARISGQPGDLLASMLAEQGAAAVRVNARVGRSAHNFWGREDFNSLLNSDQQFAPTKVIVMLGTNDLGLNLDVDKADFERIRDFYKGLGAEVWAIGPFQYIPPGLNKQAEDVVAMMQDVFGGRYIDPRPITAMQGRAGDGIHFGADAARVTADGLQQLVLTKSAPRTWLWALVGVAAAIGGAAAYGAWRKGKVKLPAIPGIGEGFAGYRVVYLSDGAKAIRDGIKVETVDAARRELSALKRRGMTAWIESDDGAFVPVPGAMRKPRELKSLGDGLAEYCSPQLPEGAFKRCVARQKRATLGEYVSPEDKIQELIFDADPSSMEIAQDLALQHGIKLSEWSARNNRGVEGKTSGRFAVEPGHRKAEVRWKIGHGGNPENVGDCHAIFSGYVDDRKVLWAEDWPEDASEGVTRAYGIKGTEDQCRRLAAQEAWAVAKELKKALATEDAEDLATDPTDARQARAVKAFHRAFARRDVNKEPKELFGAALGATPKQKFDEIMDSDESPEAMDVAEDFVEEGGYKLSKLTHGKDNYNYGSISASKREQDDSTRKVWWQIDNRADLGDNRWELRTDVLWDGTEIAALEPEIFVGTAEQARKMATANAWAFARKLRALPKASTVEDAREAARITRLSSNISRKEHLYGLDARYSGDTNRMSQGEAYAEFQRLIKEPNPADMDIAQDLALQYDVKLAQIGGGHRVPRGHFQLAPYVDKIPGDPQSAPRTGVGWHAPERVTHIGLKVAKRRGRWQPIAPSGDIMISDSVNSDGAGYATKHDAEEAINLLRTISVDEKATRPAEINVTFQRYYTRDNDDRHVGHGEILSASELPSLRRTYENVTWQEARKRAARDAWVIAKAVKRLPEDAGRAQIERAVIDALPEAEREPMELFGVALGALAWKKAGKSIYKATSPHGEYTIDGNNYGRNKWTVTYPDGDYAMVDALAEAKLEAAEHERQADARIKR